MSAVATSEISLVPASAPADPAELPSDDFQPVWLTRTTQPLVERDATPKKHRVANIASGLGSRSLVSQEWISRAPLSAWWERPDPYWETTLFDSRRNWHNAETKKGTGASAEYPYPITDSGHHSKRPTSDLDAINVATHGHLVALLRLCGIAGIEQLEALTGDKQTRKKLVQLAAAGVVEANWYHTPGLGFPRIEMWRVKLGGRYNTFTARVATAGLAATFFCGVNPQGALPGMTHARHQALSVELLLRALELNSAWAGWLPEAVCSPDKFLPDGHRYLKMEQEAATLAAFAVGRQRSTPRMDALNEEEQPDVSVRADVCLVRPDGCKVFVELQAAPSAESVVRKVINWSRLIDGGEFGGLVLFVVAAKPPQLPSAVEEVKEVIATEASVQAQQRLLIGSWMDYSPDHCAVTEEAGRLRAVWLSAASEWSETDALTHQLGMPDWGLVSKIKTLAITPKWIRTTNSNKQD